MLLLDLFRLKAWPYRHACETRRAGLYISLFLLATGILYGLLLAAFQSVRGGTLQGIPIEDIPAPILYGGNVVSGVLVVVMVHAGVTLIAWLMAKAIGGRGLIVAFYRASAYLLPLAWPTLPQVASTVVAGEPGASLPLQWLFAPLAAVGLALFLAGLFHIYELTQEKGRKLSALAVFLFALFSFAVLVAF
jgi:TRAP-type C4-dicarboxylate transport system permease small subunit